MQWVSVKLTEVHTTRHFTKTALQLTFSLHILSASYLRNIHNYHYYRSHSRPLKSNQWITQQLTAPHQSTHRTWGNMYGAWKQCLVAGITGEEMAGKDAGCRNLASYGRYSSALSCSHTLHVGSRHVPELRHPLPKDALAIKAALQSSSRNIVWCCVALRICCGAVLVIWISLKDLITEYDCLSIEI